MLEPSTEKKKFESKVIIGVKALKATVEVKVMHIGVHYCSKAEY